MSQPVVRSLEDARDARRLSDSRHVFLLCLAYLTVNIGQTLAFNKQEVN
jgi:hypothetical protein